MSGSAAAGVGAGGRGNAVTGGPAPRDAGCALGVVIVGSGIAGLTTALTLQRLRPDASITIVTKGSIDDGCTRHAQGGIASAVLPGDSVESHIADTLVAGAGLCDPAAVRVLCEEGPERLRDLLAWGVEFDRVDGGRDEVPGDGVAAGDLAGLDAGREGAHSFHRIVHAGGDATGLSVQNALVRATRAAGIRVLEHAFLADLLLVPAPEPAASGGESWRSVGTAAETGDGSARRRDSGEVGAGPRVGGAVVLREGRREVLEADEVVLASGGAGQLYPFTTNPAVATGDGIAAALRAGAAVADLEFVQFHPTALAVPGCFLVSEAVRGDGAVLRNAAGERFMPAAHPLAELAPRDVVARAIALEMERTGAPVVLDARGLGSEELERRFPTISAACRAAGFDWAREPVPVAPAAHYGMGGVVTDLDGRTSLAGLWAVGEVARTGVHGANRLASNSLLEGLVFGHRAARALARVVASDVGPGASVPVPVSVDRAAVDRAASPSLSPRRRPQREEIQALMWRHVGVLRDAEGLQSAAAALAEWDMSIDARGASGIADLPAASVHELETANLLLLARATVAAALARRESVGAHFRADAGPTSGRRHASGIAARSTTPAEKVLV
ncbi:L-aspartate oxidase [Herbiconiux sp. CPCC 203407]|uniref:L-aspartate oxidase n=1 Tax=Herbiconiux oxytropis TaxID=2970915 RepID=A0AA41XBQ2_9MICO|nr:L-aspartate oxidase [Herbiconiux oxytropis]MCS5724122.1 L-aspartate oxidase [Herbiconiux oxytropis]MCS5725281.1 L-aspartate oxidase [Herbiconiux oxytropis]